MIGDLKLGFKLMKYGLQFKMSVICASLFVLLGFIMDMLSAQTANPNSIISAYYLFGMIFAAQLISSLNASQMVQSSPYKKKLQTRMITMICMFIEFISVTAMLVLKAVMYYSNEDKRVYVINSILIISAMILIFNLYMIGATKFYWTATVLFMIVFAGFFVLVMRRTFQSIMHGVNTEQVVPVVSFPIAVLICYGAILLGGGLIYLLSTLFYRREYSKMMFKAALKT